MPFLLRLLGFNRKDFTNSHHRTNPSYRKQGLSQGLAARLAAPHTRHGLRATLETCSKLREHEATLPPEPRAATSHRCAGGGGLRASRPQPPPRSTSQAHHVYLWKTRQQLHRGSSGARGWEAVPAGHWGGPAHDTENLLMGEEEEGSCWMHTPPTGNAQGLTDTAAGLLDSDAHRLLGRVCWVLLCGTGKCQERRRRGGRNAHLQKCCPPT